MPLVLGELPGKSHCDGELPGRQIARFLVMDPPRRGRGQRLDRIGLARHEDRLDAADLAGQKQHNDLAAAVRERPAARQPAGFDRIEELVRLLHLYQDVAALKHLRCRGHGGQQLSLAALEQ